MNRKPYPITDLTGGIQVSLDPLLLVDRQAVNCSNCRFEFGLLKKDWAWIPFSALPVVGTPVYMETFWTTAGASHLMLFTTKAAYKWNTTTLEWDDYTLGTLVDSCESAWTASANVTSTDDTDFKVGAKSAKHIIDAAFTAGLASYFDFVAKDLTAATHIHAWVKSSVATTTGQLRLYLDNTSACASPLEELQIPALDADTWTRVSLAIATPAGLGAVVSVGLKVQTDIGAQTVYLDDIRAVTEFTGSVVNRFSTCTMIDTFIITNGKDAMQTFDGTAITALGGSPPIAKYVMQYYSHLLAIGTTETGTAYPQRVRWSSAGTTTTWTGGSSGYVDLVDTVDWCIAGKQLFGRCYIIKESTIWELVYIGGTSVFTYKSVFDLAGSYAPDTIYYYGDGEIVIKTGSDVILFNGQRKESISSDIFPWLYKTGYVIEDLTKDYTSVGIVLEEEDEYWLALTKQGASTPNCLLKCQVGKRAWTRRDSVDICAFGYNLAIAAPVTWATATGTWATAVGSWRTKSLAAGSPTTLIADSDGLVWMDPRSSTDSSEMIFETKDFLWAHATRVPYIRVYARYGGFTLYYSKDGGLTWSSGQAFAWQGNWKEFDLAVDETVQTLRVRLTSTSSTLEVRWIEPWYIPRARSTASMVTES